MPPRTKPYRVARQDVVASVIALSSEDLVGDTLCVGGRHGTIDTVTTVLFYLVIAAVIGLVVFFLAVFVFGRGEQMAPLDPRTSPAELPESDITSEDVRKIRFALALRGYRMSDVDWTLERLGEQLDSLRRENQALRAAPLDRSPDGADDERVAVGTSGRQIGETPEALAGGPGPHLPTGHERI